MCLEWHSAVFQSAWFRGILSISIFMLSSAHTCPRCVRSNVPISCVYYSVLSWVLLTQRILMTALIAWWKRTRVRQLALPCLLWPPFKVKSWHIISLVIQHFQPFLSNKVWYAPNPPNALLTTAAADFKRRCQIELCCLLFRRSIILHVISSLVLPYYAG